MIIIFIIFIILLILISSFGVLNLIKSLKKERDQLDKTAKILVRRDLALSEANERLQEMDRLKSEFITIAAHQLRTPLSGIKWNLNMIMSGDMGKITTEQKKFLSQGYETNERMIRLVNDLLSVSRIEEGRFGYEFVSQDIIKFFENIVNDAQRTFKEKNLELAFIKPKQSLPKIQIDQERLRLAVQNLLDNAYNYTLKGKVIISLIKKNKEIQVSIKDTGIGIPKDQTHRLFTKFFRAHNVTQIGFEGTGLGLFITKNIIEKHGGKIWTNSTLDKGTIFYFTLPI